MDKPLCRLCEKRHYGDCDPADLPEVVTPVVSGSERVKRWRKANPDKYREYQRGLMRKRRAKLVT